MAFERIAVRHNLLVASVYAATGDSIDTQEDDLYDELATLIRTSRGFDVVLVADDCNTQVGER